MKELGRFLGYGLGTAAVIALLMGVASMEDSPSWLLPMAALALVVVLPIAVGVVLTRRSKQRAGTPSNPS